MMRLMALAMVVGLALVGTSRADNPIIVVDTSMGQFEIELFEKDAPATVKNILAYVDAKFYDNTVFHRVIADFMVQCGGFEVGLKQKKANAPIKNESTNGLSNKKYTVAMARTSDPDSASSQFFVNVKDNDFLDKARAQDKVGYCVFGRVSKGTDVVDKISAAETGEAEATIETQKAKFKDVPVKEIVIKSVTRKK